MPNRTIKVDYLARVEGEGGLAIKVRDGVVTDAKLKIFEPPRFFEAFLRERSFTEAPDITARICGICPVAYQMSAVHAVENAAGVQVTGPIRTLRRLLYCGEWIESHALHVFMLHAPDFLGFDDAVQMAREHGDVVRTGLAIKKAGNAIVTLIGGREIHPINVRVGGFYKAPRKKDLTALAETLKPARDSVVKALDWARALPFPGFEVNYEYVALHHENEYPFNEGRIISSKGLDIDAVEYPDHFVEYQEPHSTALHSRIDGRGAYLVGPMARFNLNREKLTPMAAEAAIRASLTAPCNNPFQSILVRLVEILFSFEEALRLIDAYEEPDKPAVDINMGASVGMAATEAPRGLLFHRYEMDESGAIVSAKIVPPTSQNQKSIEDDLKGVAQRHLELTDDALKWRCEQTIRNYDPCISCAAHFLRLDIDRGDSGGAHP
ncbi:MAG: Ni/Fe hydrogenase subunit alpha [Pseudomonadota bacterium]